MVINDHHWGHFKKYWSVDMANDLRKYKDVTTLTKLHIAGALPRIYVLLILSNQLHKSEWECLFSAHSIVPVPLLSLQWQQMDNSFFTEIYNLLW